MEAHDRCIGVVRVDGEDVLECHGRRVVDLRARIGVREQCSRNERRGPHDDLRPRKPVGPPEGDQVGRPRARSDKADPGTGISRRRRGVS